MDKLDVFRAYRAILPSEQFILGGSTALSLYGLIPVSNSNDLDIILYNPSEYSLKVLGELQKLMPASTKPLSGYNARVNYIIKHYDLKIDFFIVKDRVNTQFEYDGIFLNTIPNIIKAKKEANRPKDWLQLRNLSRFFYKEEDFINFANGYK